MTNQIELTAKKWKARQLVGFAIGLVGVPLLFLSLVYQALWLTIVAGIVLLTGIGVIAYARAMAWWHHG